MLARVLREIPKLTDAVVGAEVEGKPSYDVASTGAATPPAPPARRPRRPPARRPRPPSGPRARPARCPGVARAEGEVKGAVASESDLAIARYDALTAEEITAG